MKLTALQEDALIELLSIGFGRAAASLSQLTGDRVVLEAPLAGNLALFTGGAAPANP